MELDYWIILRIHITEWYYGMILRNHLCEKDPGDAQDVPKATLESWGSPGHAPGSPGNAPGIPGHAPETPQGRPWDPPGTPTISRQIYGARSSQLLCSNLLVGAHRMKHSTGLFSVQKGRQHQKIPPSPGISVRRLPLSRNPHIPTIYYIYIYMAASHLKGWF